jgi:ATP-dependent RNA helicase DeaD
VTTEVTTDVPVALPIFAELGAHPTLAAALANKGYAQPTPVQAAVLGAPAQDLLVSSQTGSGKTVAFGLVMAQILLGEQAMITPSKQPRALVIAPTRELAAQVERELGWLFHGTRARTASFTGGTGLMGDARALHRGVDIAVGTPGRLVDLIERGALDLKSLEVVVLDEADEMLDLGFRDALEQILGAAPVERRTLLFSATLPAGIRALAKRYQKTPVSIDPRGKHDVPHEDIEHIAYLCAHNERLAVLVNLLRLGDAGSAALATDKTLVFCRTRDGVAELQQALAQRGFAVAGISGERAQNERTRALDAMRAGKVTVLVATNVAARGLDLPDLGRVIHADLPDGPEALTHRAGRTGRAGKKGVSAYLVQTSGRRRAENLFRDAGLKVRWAQPPDQAAISARERALLASELREAMAGDHKPSPEALDLAAELLAEHDARALLGMLMHRALAARPQGEHVTRLPLSTPSAPRPYAAARPYGGAPPPGAGKKRPPHAAPERLGPPLSSRPPRPHRVPHVGDLDRGGDYVRFSVNLGADNNAKPDWVLPMVCRRGDVTRQAIGAIRVARDHTVFEVRRELADDFAANAAERDPRAPHVRIAPTTDPLPERSLMPPGGGAGAPRKPRPR